MYSPKLPYIYPHPATTENDFFPTWIPSLLNSSVCWEAREWQSQWSGLALGGALKRGPRMSPTVAAKAPKMRASVCALVWEDDSWLPSQSQRGPTPWKG